MDESKPTRRVAFAPVYEVEGKEFIFAYQDQLFDTIEDAKVRGMMLGAQLKEAGSGAKYAGYAVPVDDVSKYDVEEIPITGWKVVFLEWIKVKTKRGKRGRRSANS